MKHNMQKWTYVGDCVGKEHLLDRTDERSRSKYDLVQSMI